MNRCVFDDIIGQERVAAFLRRATADRTTAHAYLFVGPPGSGKKSTARALACALLCDDAGCGACSSCTRIRRNAHPDVRVFEPEGAAAYMVEQVRELIADVNFRSVEGAGKVYVLDRAESFNPQAANALLKTLEEPPPRVTIVLLSTSYEAVLPTIASRCQVVRFAPIAPSAAARLLSERTGVDAQDAVIAMAASGGVVPRALEFLRSPGRRAVRDHLLDVLADLPVMDGQDVLKAARELLAEVKGPLDDLKAAQEEELRERVEFLGKTAGSLKPIEERHKRELSAREREGVGELVMVTESWLRDAVAAAEGAPETIANADVADVITAIGRCTSPEGLTKALGAVSEARRRIAYNVSPQLALEVMLFQIQEEIRCPR